MKQHGMRLIVALNVALVVFLAWLWVGLDGKLRDVAWHPPQPIEPGLSAQAASLPASKAMDVSLFIATLDRPLFSPNRRPAPPPPKETAKAEPDLLAGLHLYGLYATENGPAGILARVDGKIRRIADNEVLSGWMLKAIEDRHAIFVKDGQERVIPLAITRPVASAKSSAGSQSVPASGGAAAAPGASAEDLRQQMEDAQRDLLRRRNELRAKAGAKPLSQ